VLPQLSRCLTIELFPWLSQTSTRSIESSFQGHARHEVSFGRVFVKSIGGLQTKN